MAIIDLLPTELLIQIFAYIDGPASIPAKVYDIPSKMVDLKTLCPDGPSKNHLKNASLVNRRWRQLCYPLLFRHLQWHIPLDDEDGKTLGDDLLRFLVQSKADPALVESLTVFAFAKNWSCDIIDPSEQVKESCNSLWSTVFSRIDPTRLTIIGDQPIIALLAGIGPLSGTESWLFDLPIQILQLSLDERPKPPSQTPPPPDASALQRYQPRSTLLSIRGWTDLLLNEGSFLQIYTTYEYHNLYQPSLLDVLSTNIDSPEFRSFSYISVFPISTYFSSVIARFLPIARDVYFQLLPHERDFSRIMNPSTLGHMDVRDPWMECDAVWDLIQRRIFTNHMPGSSWDRIRRFTIDYVDDEDDVWRRFRERAEARIHGERRWIVDRTGSLLKDLSESDSWQLALMPPT